MRTFLGLLMVLMASGDDEMTINGFLEDSVLLPCSCPNRNLDMVFKWQMDEPNKALVFKYHRSISSFSGRYKGRGKVFLAEDSNNCSILLTNFTQDDKGKYTCIFHVEELYKRSVVNLDISENPRPAKPNKDQQTGSLKNRADSSKSACFMRHFKTIPVVAVLGFSLISNIVI